MADFENMIDSFADTLNEEGCEFVVVVQDANNNARVIHSDNAALLLSMIFQRSDSFYGMFKRAERMADYPQSFVSLN